MTINDRQALLRRVCLLKLALTQSEFTYQDYLTMQFNEQPVINQEIQDVRDTFNKDCRILETCFGVAIQPKSRNIYQVRKIHEEFQSLYLNSGWLQVLGVLRLPQNNDLFPPGLIQAITEDVQRRYGTSSHKPAEVFEKALAMAAWRDHDAIHPRIFEALWYAQKERFIIDFAYNASRDTDNELRQHRVEPYRIYVEAGHLYLYGYNLKVIGPFGEFDQNIHRDYRIGRIVEGTLTVHSERFTLERKSPQFIVHYILSSRLASRGASKTFDEEYSRTTLPDGRLEIRASTTDKLKAVQKLLRYGGQVEVIGSEEIREMYLKELEAMVAYYK